VNQGIRTVIYPVKDLAQAKTLYSTLLGVEPSVDEAYDEVRPVYVHLIDLAILRGGDARVSTPQSCNETGLLCLHVSET
jgi:catechol 2,3-dioxygenase-like lactoylglutathione lyase family enzyme